MGRKIFVGIVLLFGSLLVLTHFSYVSVMDIETPFRVDTRDSTRLDETPRKQVVHVGVVSRYPPALIYQGYQPIMDYLTQHSDFVFELRLSSSYHETVRQLERGDVSAAFLGSVVYVRERAKSGLQCILKPLNENGEAWSRSVLVTRTDSPIRQLEDLRGKKIALPSQDSFSGIWLPSLVLNTEGLQKRDIARIDHYVHHQTVVFQVLKGSYDAGVVKESIAQEYLPRGLRILQHSPTIPTSPLVTTSRCDPRIVSAIRDNLLRIDVRDQHYRDLVVRWDRDLANGFVVASDRDYDTLSTLLTSHKVP